MEEINDEMSDNQQVLELGIMLGQRRAFGPVAGRCSAAQAECLRKVREQKSYLKFAPSWGEFCERYLKICKRTADRAIALLKKHGALYFETAALTGITPAEQDGIHNVEWQPLSDGRGSPENAGLDLTSAGSVEWQQNRPKTHFHPRL